MPRQFLLALGLAFAALAAGPISGTASADGTTQKVEKAEHDAVAHPESAVEHAPGGGHGEAAQPNILEPQPRLAIWTVVVFLGLLFVLGRFAWKPLLAALHHREEHLEHVLLDTEKARNESERMLAEHRKLLAQAADQVRGMLDEARRDAQSTSEAIVGKAQAEAESSLQRANREIGVAKDQAMTEIWTKTADLAVSVAGKVLARDLGPDDHRRLVEVAMNELPAGPGGRS